MVPGRALYLLSQGPARRCGYRTPPANGNHPTTFNLCNYQFY
ncbi:hypothetical protein PITC_076520 [Penicillium italicum]|uniref:Uncharacterized protein n=1 Tax=Penicillium italicum TaxID=40296 RepID=A0A0A2L766_PENIT|nr:hypothetical protein PITC_076520 [Penicillium italicum]